MLVSLVDQSLNDDMSTWNFNNKLPVSDLTVKLVCDINSQIKNQLILLQWMTLNTYSSSCIVKLKTSKEYIK